tara:strand:+ start:8239 stop:8883 length:645 start_codon:yes stop_codon:yes gene_type:complete
MDKQKISEESSDRFMMIVWSLVEPFGMDKNEEVLDSLNGLSEVVAKQKGRSTKLHKERRAFIAVFKEKYYRYSEIEYTKSLGGGEARNIGRLLNEMAVNNLSWEKYLDWLFDVHLNDNPGLFPVDINKCCWQRLVHKYIFEHKDETNIAKEGIKRVKRERLLVDKLKASAAKSKGKYDNVYKRSQKALRGISKMTLDELNTEVMAIEREMEGSK